MGSDLSHIIQMLVETKFIIKFSRVKWKSNLRTQDPPLYIVLNIIDKKMKNQK